jgi:hypothetical protein
MGHPTWLDGIMDDGDHGSDARVAVRSGCAIGLCERLCILSMAGGEGLAVA